MPSKSRRPIAVLLLTVWFFLMGLVPAWATVPFYEGGISNEQEYREVLFITGTPIVVSGQPRETTTTGRDGAVTNRITATLENKDLRVKVTRSYTYITTKEIKGTQELFNTRVGSFSETITVDKDKFVLAGYQYSGSAITDKQPAVAYTSGSWNSRKTYSVNGTAGQVVVETQGFSVGYQHAWGSTTTRTIDGTVTYDAKITIDKVVTPVKWTGTYRVNSSHNRGRHLAFLPTEPAQISFEGSYIDTAQSTGTMNYTYNMPRLDRGLVVGTARNQGNAAQQLTTLPTQKRLPVKTLRDMNGHWASEDVQRLVSLEVLEVPGEYFGPRLPMTRGEFATALVKAMQMPLPQPPPPPKTTTKNPPVEESLFADVPVSDPSYRYYQAVQQLGVMKGVGNNIFHPTGELTRAQALTIIVRTLGLEGLAPVGSNLTTPFRDDAQIPSWAREAVYVGHQLGLAKGDHFGYFHPNEPMSRAEAATFLNRFINYLQKEMKAEYRERILYYR